MDGKDKKVQRCVAGIKSFNLLKSVSDAWERLLEDYGLTYGVGETIDEKYKRTPFGDKCINSVSISMLVVYFGINFLHFGAGSISTSTSKINDWLGLPTNYLLSIRKINQ